MSLSSPSPIHFNFTTSKLKFYFDIISFSHLYLRSQKELTILCVFLYNTVSNSALCSLFCFFLKHICYETIPPHQSVLRWNQHSSQLCLYKKYYVNTRQLAELLFGLPKYKPSLFLFFYNPKRDQKNHFHVSINSYYDVQSVLCC